MRPSNSSALSVAEGLLPLLDVSILLLGFFLILFASGAFSPEPVEPAPTEASLPGIGQVILLRVEGPDRLFVSGGSVEGDSKPSSLDTLPNDLVAVKQPRGEDEPIVLVYYADPWADDFPAGWEHRLYDRLRRAGCRYARTFP